MPRTSRPARRASRTDRWVGRIRFALLAIAGAFLIVGVSGVAAPTEGNLSHLAAPAVADASGGHPVETQWGTLDDNDRELLIRVRQAGLWEYPAGMAASVKGANKRVREIGPLIAKDHIFLDQGVIALAKKLNVPLPEKPSEAQQTWLNEMDKSNGQDFDKVFANRLRDAHASVYGLVALIKAKSSNSEVRKFADVGMTIVARHMTLLDSTGLVAHDAADTLAKPPMRGPFTLPMIIAVVVAAVVGNMILAARRSWS